jgi:putative oxidoreductase
MKVLRVIIVAVVIGAIAKGIGFGVNALRPRETRLSLIRTPPAQAYELDLTSAKREFDRHTAIFVDARERPEYEAGHIRGALNLPSRQVGEEYPKVLGKRVDPTQPIITYCGPDCESARELALALMTKYHHEHVWALQDPGFEGWRGAGFPVESGPMPGEKPIPPQPTSLAATVIPIVLLVVGALLVLLTLATHGGTRSWWVTLARVFTGAVLIWASYHKILEPNEFAKGIIAYKAIPYGWSNLPAITMPWLELTAGVLLVVGAATRASALIASLLYLAFLAMMLSAKARGIEILDCHCFGFAEPLTWPVLFRDVALLAAALVPLFAGPGRAALDRLRRGPTARAAERQPG